MSNVLRRGQTRKGTPRGGDNQGRVHPDAGTPKDGYTQRRGLIHNWENMDPSTKLLPQSLYLAETWVCTGMLCYAMFTDIFTDIYREEDEGVWHYDLWYGCFACKDRACIEDTLVDTKH